MMPTVNQGPTEGSRRDGVTLVVTSLDPDEKKLNRMLKSAAGFDEIILHIDPATKLEPKIGQAGSPMRRIYTAEHLEVGAAYDQLVENVKTEWVAPFFDDDYFEVEGLASILSAIRAQEADDADIAHFRVMVTGYVPLWVDRRGMAYLFLTKWIAPLLKKKGLFLDVKYLMGQPNVSAKIFEKGNWIPAGSFFRKSVWEKVGGFKGKIMHDWIFWLRAARLGCRFKFFDYIVYNHERRPGSTLFKQFKEEAGGSMKKAREIVNKEAMI